MDNIVGVVGPSRFLQLLKIIENANNLEAINKKEGSKEQSIADFILERVAEEYSISAKQVLEKRKNVEAKMVATNLIYHYSKLSMTEVAKVMEYSSTYMVWKHIDDMNTIIQLEGVYTSIKAKYEAISVKTETFIKMLELN
ncbi:hypothetical protein [uncultured Microscilla sp.]|uniref:hypothetical protein n=1 Tax=uncultured Microscilla sp. TaxID=432653 RepID=UPI002616F5DD|nr:hypothetical protein [uncultured Microscilla sp.]